MQIDIDKDNIKTICPQCTHTSPRGLEYDNEKAMIYLKLTSEKCPREKAQVYCQKRQCLYDTTKKVDGPGKYRVLKAAFNQKQIQNRGWTSPLNVKFEMGQKYLHSAQSLLSNNNEQQELEEFFLKNESKIKNDFKAKISTLQNYLKDLNSKYNIQHSSIGTERLIEKLEEIKDNQQEFRRKPMKYLKFKGQRYFEIAEDYAKMSSQVVYLFIYIKEQYQEKRNILNDFSPFRSNVDFPFDRIQMKEKLPDEVFQHIDRDTIKQVQFSKDKYYFDRLKNQSDYVLKLHESKGVSDAFGVSKVKAELDQQTIRDLQGKEKMTLASEFNKSQYMFKINEPAGQSQRIKFTKLDDSNIIQKKKKTINFDKLLFQSESNSPSRQTSRKQYQSLITPPKTQTPRSNTSMGSKTIHVHNKYLSLDLQSKSNRTISTQVKSEFDMKLDSMVQQNISIRNQPQKLLLKQLPSQYDSSSLLSIKQKFDTEKLKIIQRLSSRCNTARDHKPIKEKPLTIKEMQQYSIMGPKVWSKFAQK